MKKNFINKDKLKKIGGVVLVASMLAAPVSGLAQSYTVQPGDTLKRISQDFYGRNDYYDEIAYLNNISDPNMIRAGDVIYLPNDYRELEFCGQDDKWVSNDILYYTFGPKDNLWNLADKFYGDGRYWKCLADYNGITNPKKIRDGKVIKIPPFAYLNMDALNYTFEGDSNTNNQSGPSIRSHTFVEGDTLWALASKYYGNGNYWEPLATYNNRLVFRKDINHDGNVYSYFRQVSLDGSIRDFLHDDKNGLFTTVPLVEDNKSSFDIIDENKLESELDKITKKTKIFKKSKMNILFRLNMNKE